MSKQGTPGARKHIVLQTIEIFRKHESGEIPWDIMASYNIGSPTIYDIKKQKDNLHLSGSMKDFSSNRHRNSLNKHSSTRFL